MLRTNSKKAMENTINYILSDSDYLDERASYDGITLESPKDYLRFVYKCFKEETQYNASRASEFDTFTYWASGLALGGMFLYYYNVSAVDTLGSILEESESEKSKYTEEQAEN